MSRRSSNALKPSLLSEDVAEAVWVPVEVSGPLPAGEAQQVVLATDQTVLDTVPGLWPNGAREGMLLVANLEEVDEPLECGTVVGEVVQGPTVTQVCGACAGVDTWLSESNLKCSQCGLLEPDRRKWSASSFECLA